MKYARAHGVIATKNRGSRGFPDYTFYTPGGYVWIVEFKRPGGKLRPDQVRIIAELRANGHPVLIVDNVDAFKYAIDVLLRKGARHEMGTEAVSVAGGRSRDRA